MSVLGECATCTFTFRILTIIEPIRLLPPTSEAICDMPPSSKKRKTPDTASSTFFADIPAITYEGPDSDNPLAFKYYNAEEVVAGRKMKDWCRFAVCYWHTWRGVRARESIFRLGTPAHQHACGSPDALLNRMLLRRWVRTSSASVAQ